MVRIVKYICVMFIFLLAVGTAQAATITVAPTDTQLVSNTYPFGGGSVGWTPYLGFIYRNVPAFNLQPGDILAFDLGLQNDVDIQLDIAMARTTVNGGTVEAVPFTTVVTNTQTPQNPRGDTILGNFELRFAVEQPFSFPGGGLIIRFSSPSAGYAADSSPNFNLVGATSSDASGYFVDRFYRDSNGVSTWDNEGTSSIGGFQITTDIVCGDGAVQGAESCDDGNTDNNDGCSSTCAIESSWDCIGEPSVCTSIVCGDGAVQGAESCDDGNTDNNDGCSGTCAIESGWNCIGEPSVCTSVCGDGAVQGAESCDDGNTDNNDGCSGTCAIESGWNCIGEPSVCTTAVTCPIERLICYDIIATDENSTANIDYWAVCLDNGGTGSLHSDNAQNTYNLYLFGGGPGWFNTSGSPAVGGNPGWTTWIARGANESGFLQPIGNGYLLTGAGRTGNTRYTVQGKKVPCIPER